MLRISQRLRYSGALGLAFVPHRKPGSQTCGAIALGVHTGKLLSHVGKNGRELLRPVWGRLHRPPGI
jgi:hypothetical protein